MRALVLALLAASSAQADVPIGGRIFTDAYLPTRNPRETPYSELSGNLWLTASPKLGENSFSQFTLATRLDEAERGVSVDLREGYAGYAKNGWEVRAGRQIIPWGKSDGVIPTDFLSAKDFTFRNPEDDVRRVAGTSLLGAWTPAAGTSSLTFTAVWTPLFPQSRLLISSDAVPAGVNVLDTVSPPATLTNSEVALKASYQAVGWDASLSAFRGWNHFPEFAEVSRMLNPATGAVSVALAPTFHRVRALGADASLSLSKWILRAETAYVVTENDDGRNALIQPSHFDAVAGVERPIGDDFRVQTQLIWRFHPSFEDPALAGGADPVSVSVNRSIAETNALLLGYQDRSRPGATFRFGYDSEERGIESELWILGNFVGGDYLIRPKFSYSWTDALRTTVGVEHYGGPKDRPLGSLREYNSLFAEAKYSF